MLIFIGFFVCGTTSQVFGASLEKRYVFIDGGADVGQVYSVFQSISLYSPDVWEIYAIEPNPNVFDLMPRFPNLTIISKAIWIKEGFVTFYQNLAHNRNSTASLFQESLEKPRAITVESMDFSQWIKRNFTKEDYIILNMDIEEAEYAVLEQMLKDKTITYIDRLFVEFNNDGGKENNRRKDQILKQLKDLEVFVKTRSLWSVLTKEVFGETSFEWMNQD